MVTDFKTINLKFKFVTREYLVALKSKHDNNRLKPFPSNYI